MRGQGAATKACHWLCIPVRNFAYPRWCGRFSPPSGIANLAIALEDADKEACLVANVCHVGLEELGLEFAIAC